MSEEVNAIPAGYEGITPYLICNAEAAIEFYKKALGAVELFRIGQPGMVGHAEMKIEDRAIVMLADEHPDMGIHSPQTIGGSAVHLLVYVADVDSFCEKALSEGMEVLRPVADQFYGDRSGQFKDPFGHIWSFATHIEDVLPAEMNERAAAKYGA